MTVLVSPRCNRKHQRRALFSRLTRGRAGQNQFDNFLTAQATRLSTTRAVIFARLVKNTAARIRAAASLGALS